MDKVAKRAGLVKEARKILDKVEEEKRSLTTEERAKYDNIMSEVDTIGEEIKRDQELRNIEQTINAKPTATTERSSEKSDEYRTGFDKYMRRGKSELDNAEFRALNTGTGSQGGYLVPTLLNDTIIKKLSEANVMRFLGTSIFTTNDKNLPISNNDGTASWTAESATISDSDGSFSNVLLGAYKAAAIMKVSDELLSDNGFDLEAFITQDYVRRISQLEETAFVNGTGTGQPTGVIGAGSVGVTTASATAIVSDEIIDLYYSLKSQYRTRGSWLLGTDTIKAIRKLKDSNGSYIWQPGFADKPDTLLGRPVFESSAVPAISTGNKVAGFGDFSYYYIATRGRVAIQRLNELYAANGQVGFRGYQRVDGNLTNSDAVKILQMA